MIDNLLLFLNQYTNNLWAIVAYVYLFGFIVTLILSFASAMTLGYEPKGCSALAVSMIMIPVIIVWPLFWIVVIVSVFIKARNT